MPLLLFHLPPLQALPGLTAPLAIGGLQSPRWPQICR